MLELLGTGICFWFLEKILNSGINIYFDAKTEVLKDEFLFHHYRLQLEKENELFQQYLILMHFLGDYSKLISFRKEFLEEMLNLLEEKEESSQIVGGLTIVLGEKNEDLGLYKRLELLSQIGRFMKENQDHKVVPLFFHAYVEEKGDDFRRFRLQEIEVFFMLEKQWLCLHEVMFQTGNKGKLLEQKYLQVLEDIETNTALILH